MTGFILAGNYQQYRRCIEERGLDRQEWPYLGQLHDLYGRSGPLTIQFYGTWYARQDATDLLNYAKMLGATVLDSPPSSGLN